MPASPQNRHSSSDQILTPIHQRLQTRRDVTDTAYADVRVVGEHVRTAGAEGVLAENQVPLVGGSRVGSAGEVERAVVHDEVGVLVGWAVHAHGVAVIRGGHDDGLEVVVGDEAAGVVVVTPGHREVPRQVARGGLQLQGAVVGDVAWSIERRQLHRSPAILFTYPLVHSPSHSFRHSLTHSLGHSLVPSPAHSFIHSPTLSFTHPLTLLATHPRTRSLSHPLIQSRVYPFTHPPTHSFTHSTTN